jgi:hypothetical protein
MTPQTSHRRPTACRDQATGRTLLPDRPATHRVLAVSRHPHGTNAARTPFALSAPQSLALQPARELQLTITSAIRSP